MGLLAPLFLAAGVAAVALPVWLHLLRRHRNTPLPFSSLMFFERRTQSSVKHRRLHYLLLFALRTALLVLIALAFAKPYFTGSAAGIGAAGLRVLAIDDSFSMRQGHRLARAKSEALAQLRAGQRAQVVSFGSRVRVLTEPTTDLAALRAAVESVQPSDSRGSYGELVRVLRVVSESVRVPVELHLFSDMQKTGLPPGFSDLRLPPGARLIPHDVGGGVANFTIESVTAPGRVYGTKQARVGAAVAAYGGAAGRRRVSLVVNGKPVETKEVEVQANGRAAVEFLNVNPPHGLSRGEVRIEPADAFPSDDRHLFAIERADTRPALLVSERANPRAELYFRSAIESSGNAPFRLEPARASEAAGRDLAQYGFVLLADVSYVSEDFGNNLKKYLREGGAVWLSLGPAVAGARRAALLDNAVIEDRYFARNAERFETASYLDTGHPSIGQAGNWQGVKFYHAVSARVPQARSIARLGDGTPVLFEVPAGLGRILVFASTFDNVSNDFPLHAAFVPFIEQTARYLGAVDDAAPFLTVDSHIELRRGAGRAAAIEVIGPDGRRALTLKEAASAPAFALEREGFYEVRRGSGRQQLLAVNADRHESNFDRLPDETLALWQKTGSGGPAGQAQGEQQQARVNMWWYVMAAAALLALAESWVGNRYLEAQPAPEEKKVYKEAAA